MKETMGQIIRRLRKERNLTQEELAEQLGVTFQAVSKWENDSGMPDVSQIVPIAHVFGVSTDVLFGTYGKNETEEVFKIINAAEALILHPITAKSLFAKYCAVKEGLKQYPNNPVLLMHCLETGMTLSYPENEELYDAEHAKTIYHECIRYATLVISYSTCITDILRAHMIMVMLHSAYGNFDKAEYHANKFPYRADYNNHVMYAYYSHWKKNYKRETQCCQTGVLYYFESMLDIIAQLAKSYMLQEKYTDAATALETAIELIDCIFKGNEILPPIHHRDHGDLYMLLAEAWLKDGNPEKALMYLEKMVDYDLKDYAEMDENTPAKSPLPNSILNELYRKRPDRHQRVLNELTDLRFASLRTNDRYRKLIEAVGE